MTTKVNVMVSLEVNRRGKGVEDDYQSECNGESGGVRGWKMTTKVNVMVSLEVNRRGEGVEDDY